MWAKAFCGWLSISCCGWAAYVGELLWEPVTNGNIATPIVASSNLFVTRLIVPPRLSTMWDEGAIYLRVGSGTNRVSQRMMYSDPSRTYGYFMASIDSTLIVKNDTDLLFLKQKDGRWEEDGRITRDGPNSNEDASGPVAVNGKYLVSGAEVFSWPSRTFIQNLLPAPNRDELPYAVALGEGGHLALGIGTVNPRKEVRIFQEVGGRFTNAFSLLDPAQLTEVRSQFGVDAVFGPGDQLFLPDYYNSEVVPYGGVVHVFTPGASGEPADWALTQSLRPRSPMASDAFGQQIALEGNRLYVSTPYRNEERQLAGAIFVFERNEGGLWQEVDKIVLHGEVDRAQLGTVMTVHDGVVYACGQNKLFAFHPAVSLKARRINSTLTLELSRPDRSGVWESTTDLNSSWSVDGSSPIDMNAAARSPARFYRMRFESAY